jgi:hypothetical protein
MNARGFLVLGVASIGVATLACKSKPQEEPVATCPGVDLKTDVKNCGRCGSACGSDEVCAIGECFKTKCESHPKAGAATAGAEIAVLPCHMQPGTPVTVSLHGTHLMTDNAVFPECTNGLCDDQPYSVRTIFGTIGFNSNPHCEGRHSQACALEAEGVVWVPSTGNVVVRFRLDGCDWSQHQSCDLSFVTLTVKQ